MSSCSVCGLNEWSDLYSGPVRDGRFESRSFRAGVVRRCGGCGSARLEGDPIDYSGTGYRESVDGGVSLGDYFRLHDASQVDHLRLVGTNGLHGARVADVGCGAGRFLDLLKGFTAAPTLGIEPALHYQGHLRAGGHEVYASAAEALDWSGHADLVTCFSTIEHVEDPLRLLMDAHSLIRPGGRMVVTTPNLDDILLELLPTDYGAFFFRRVHRWYFDRSSLAEVCRRAGFEVRTVKSFHRFDLSNLLVWLRDRRPGGGGRIRIPVALDAAYRASLEESGRGDYLVAELAKGA